MRSLRCAQCLGGLLALTRVAQHLRGSATAFTTSFLAAAFTFWKTITYFGIEAISDLQVRARRVRLRASD